MLHFCSNVLKVLYPPSCWISKRLAQKECQFLALKQQFTLIVKALCSLKYDREAFCPVSTNSSISPCPVHLTWIFYTFLSCAASPILDMTIGLYGTEIECIQQSLIPRVWVCSVLIFSYRRMSNSKQIYYQNSYTIMDDNIKSVCLQTLNINGIIRESHFPNNCYCL